MAIQVRLYGKLRRYAQDQRADAESVVNVEYQPGETIGQVLAQLGIASEEISHVFLNGELSAPSRRVSEGDRLGLFPEDMALLYTWYFEKKG